MTSTTKIIPYQKDGKNYVRFSHNGQEFDCTVKEAEAILCGLGLFFLLLFLLTLALDHERNRI